jgi:DNA invertase Pin-like site-specific DNA recombinase
VIYTRISRDDTGAGRSNERQEEACRKLTDLRGWEVVAIEADISISAYSGKTRPAWQRVLERVRNGEVDVIVAWHIDRITRSMLELENLIVLSEAHGIGVATATGDIDLTTDVGRMVARILAAVARAEVERKGARQRLANEQRAKAGTPHATGRAFGYANDRVTVVAEEAQAIRQAAKQVLAGTSLSAIVRDWTARGLLSYRGSWTHRGVRQLLLNPRYIGIRVHKGVEVGPGNWEPILDKGTHLALRAFLDAPARKREGDRGPVPTTLLTGIATCSTCRGPIGANSIGKRLTYACVKGHVTHDREPIDEWVNAVTVGVLASPDYLTHLLPRVETQGQSLQEEHSRITQELRDYTVARNAGNITMDQMIMGSAPLIARLEELDLVIESATRESVGPDLTLGLPEVRARWANGELVPLEAKRTIIRRLYRSIVLVPVGQGRRTKPPIQERVLISFRNRAELHVN